MREGAKSFGDARRREAFLVMREGAKSFGDARRREAFLVMREGAKSFGERVGAKGLRCRSPSTSSG
jgi:hypothetical protein